MPIANVINQATATAAQLRICPHAYIRAPNALGVPHCWHNRISQPTVIIRGQTRQTKGRDVSMRKQANPRPFLICPCVVTASPLLCRAGQAAGAAAASQNVGEPILKRPRIRQPSDRARLIEFAALRDTVLPDDHPLGAELLALCLFDRAL
jgi:hypothetical protein